MMLFRFKFFCSELTYNHEFALEVSCMVGRTLFFQLQNRQLEYGVEQSTPWEFAFHAVKTDRFECIGYEFIQLCWNLNRHQYSTKYETAFTWLLLAKVRQIIFFTSGRTQTDILVKRSNLCLIHIDWSPETMIFDPLQLKQYTM